MTVSSDAQLGTGTSSPTTDAGVHEPAPVVAPRDFGRRSRIAVAMSGLMLMASGSVSARPALVLIGMGAVTCALMLRWLHVQLAVPAAALALLCYAVIVGSIAAWLNLDLFSRPW